MFNLAVILPLLRVPVRQGYAQEELEALIQPWFGTVTLPMETKPAEAEPGSTAQSGVPEMWCLNDVADCEIRPQRWRPVLGLHQLPTLPDNPACPKLRCIDVQSFHSWDSRCSCSLFLFSVMVMMCFTSTRGHGFYRHKSVNLVRQLALDVAAPPRRQPHNRMKRK